MAARRVAGCLMCARLRHALRRFASRLCRYGGDPAHPALDLARPGRRRLCRRTARIPPRRPRGGARHDGGPLSARQQAGRNRRRLALQPRCRSSRLVAQPARLFLAAAFPRCARHRRAPLCPHAGARLDRPRGPVPARHLGPGADRAARAQLAAPPAAAARWRDARAGQDHPARAGRPDPEPQGARRRWPATPPMRCSPPLPCSAPSIASRATRPTCRGKRRAAQRAAGQPSSTPMACTCRAIPACSCSCWSNWSASVASPQPANPRPATSWAPRSTACMKASMP